MTTTFNNSNAIPPQRRGSATKDFLDSKTVANVLNQVKPTNTRQLIDLPADATVEQALDVLLQHDILSVPVYHMQGQGKQYVTIVSVLDLLKLVSTQVKSWQHLLCTRIHAKRGKNFLLKTYIHPGL